MIDYFIHFIDIYLHLLRINNTSSVNHGSDFAAIFSIVGLVYQYGHASEVVDSITVESDIDNFDKL
jgi:hypothetical protein